MGADVLPDVGPSFVDVDERGGDALFDRGSCGAQEGGDGAHEIAKHGVRSFVTLIADSHGS